MPTEDAGKWSSSGLSVARWNCHWPHFRKIIKIMVEKYVFGWYNCRKILKNNHPNKERNKSLPNWRFYFLLCSALYLYSDNTFLSEEEHKSTDLAFPLYFKLWSQERPSQYRQRGWKEVGIQVYKLIGLAKLWNLAKISKGTH